MSPHKPGRPAAKACSRAPARPFRPLSHMSPGTVNGCARATGSQDRARIPNRLPLHPVPHPTPSQVGVPNFSELLVFRLSQHRHRAVRSHQDCSGPDHVADLGGAQAGRRGGAPHRSLLPAVSASPSAWEPWLSWLAPSTRHPRLWAVKDSVAGFSLLEALM